MKKIKIQTAKLLKISRQNTLVLFPSISLLSSAILFFLPFSLSYHPFPYIPSPSHHPSFCPTRFRLPFNWVSKSVSPGNVFIFFYVT